MVLSRYPQVSLLDRLRCACLTFSPELVREILESSGCEELLVERVTTCNEEDCFLGCLKDPRSKRVARHTGCNVSHLLCDFVRQVEWPLYAEDDAAQVATLLAHFTNQDPSTKRATRALKIGEGHTGKPDSRAKREWAKAYGALLGRYRCTSTMPIYKGTHGEIWKVKDLVHNDKQCGFKISRNRKAFEKDVAMRTGLERCRVLPVIRTHVPLAEQDLYSSPEYLQDPLCSQPEEIDGQEHQTYVMIIEWPDRSLSDVASAEQLAGQDCGRVQVVLHSLALCLSHLHSVDIVHRQAHSGNIFLWEDSESDTTRCVLTNFECAAHAGSELENDEHPLSDAYLPPEHFQAISLSKTQTANCASDVWTFGVLAYELCTGLSLFPSDVSSRSLVDGDSSELIDWYVSPNHCKTYLSG